MQTSPSSEGLKLTPAELPEPVPAAGEVLVGVHAAGVTPSELLWYPTTHTRKGLPRSQAVPGHEFSGSVAAVGEEVTTFAVGDEIFGMNDWFAEGATAEFCLADSHAVAPKPATLTHAQAATVPISALTAWQGLFLRGGMKPGDRLLVQGGSGAVGLFAVQLARLHGAVVTATSSADHRELLTALGAELVIDYKAERFEERVGAVDLVLDTVGGDTLARSWSVLSPAGRLVTIAAQTESSADPRAQAAFFIVEANGSQLLEIARLLDTGALRTFVKAALPFTKAPLAYAGAIPLGPAVGKTVLVL